MKNSYRHDIADHLAALATKGDTMTYGELAGLFGGTARSWGNVLGGIAIRCKEAQLPLLSVIVVNATTGMPSVDALLYDDLGLTTDEQLKAERERCFAFDWSRTPLGRSE